MAGANTTAIAFIGFGEVGQTFSRGLLANDGVAIRAYDLLFGSDAGARLEAAAQELGVVRAPSAQEACSNATFVFSAVTADRAEAVATEAAVWLKPGQVFVDVNSAAPSTKQRAAQAVTASGADYLEAAVMAPVLKPGLKVAILSGGPQAQAASEALNELGMNLTPVSEVYGRASAMKLCRSIVIKGLEALMVDCAAACEAWDVKDPVFASLNATFPSIDFHALAADMRERVATHGVRRSAEMREAAEMLAAAGLHPGVAQAVADAQLRGARRKEGTR
ncbi:3-hydroxyisobutyrate dehydrogenase [Bosea lupini]|jgi:3-hydroxyisobutyrate dehydrogenase-like beta-hydroxyacid dehydrogenase|uniref:3-hydroxyisobutyrate dehydrogenase n=1 Tax=Bosea lupini TaxID=1036779 RepID=A0A1H7T0H5_9HYPH|nr:MULTISPECIES: NAD(P)-dependent oxidoreductase [Bosea]SEL78422.1 3-hydroxyisobutyrate dehydrogenase [Bosea lupini]